MKNYLGLIGLIPFIILFAGLLGTKMKSYIVAFITLVTSGVLAFFIWHSPISVIGYATLEGFIIACIPILWVIFAAIFTYHISMETGAMDVIKKSLSELSPDINIQAVLISFCLGGFLESVAGFGTAVAIPTAMLMALGFNPVKSAVISLVANSVPVAFGALGIPVIVLSKITALDLALLTKYVAVQLLPFALIIPVVLLIIANGSVKGISKSLYDTLFIGFVFTAVQTIIGFFVGPELVAVSGSLSAIVLYSLYRRFKADVSFSNGKNLFVAVLNYIILLALVLATRLPNIPALKAFPFTLTIPVGSHTVPIEYLTTPGTLLILSAIIGGLIQGISFNKIFSLGKITAIKIIPAALTIISIVALAKVMGYSGMILSVAGMLSSTTGSFYPLFAPMIGALGTFVTGSDTSSNILLGELQKNAAINTGYSPEWISASNTSGATAGKMISPQSIAVASSAVVIERESDIIKKTLPFCFAYTVLLGIYVYVVALFIK